MGIYRPYSQRRVLLPPGFEEEVLAAIRALPLDGRENVLMMEFILKRHDPEASCLCGHVGVNIDIFADPISGAPNTHLVVSIDHDAGAEPDAWIHGVAAGAFADQSARRLVLRHRRLPG